MTNQCIKLIDAIKNILTILCDEVEFEFKQKRLQRIHNTFSIVDPKKRAVEIINATEIDTELQDHEAFNANISYDRERMLDSYTLEITDLLKIKEEDVLDIEYNNDLPSKIRFSQLSYPIYSLSFMSIIKEVRFGNKENYIYNQETYTITKKYLLDKGYNLPENVFQTHYFFVYLYKFLPTTYVESCFPQNYSEVLSGVFSVIDMLQRFNGHKTANLYNPSLKYEIDSVDKLDKETLDKMMTDYWIPWGPGPCKGCITIKNYGCDGNNAGLLYNSVLNKYLGVYDLQDDVTDFYRSVPDYINTMLSQPHTLLLLVAFKTYVTDNDVSLDDGVQFEVIVQRWGPNIDYCLYIITKGFELDQLLDMDDHREILADRLGVPIDEIKEQHPGFTQGWLGAVPW